MSDYLNQKMEGLKKAYDAHWGEVMNRHRQVYRDGEPCPHRGCLSHVSHPCEGCGRIAGRYPEAPSEGHENESP